MDFVLKRRISVPFGTNFRAKFRGGRKEIISLGNVIN